MSKRPNVDDDSKRTRRRGRPSVIESKGDPHLALKASAMRSAGYSWSKIAFFLGVGKTSARRLARLSQKEDESQIGKASNNRVQKESDAKHQKEGGQWPALSIEEGILECMPKTFRIFASLVKRAQERD